MLSIIDERDRAEERFDAVQASYLEFHINSKKTFGNDPIKHQEESELFDEKLKNAMNDLTAASKKMREMFKARKNAKELTEI